MTRSKRGKGPKGRAHEERGRRPNWVEKAGLLAALASVLVAIVALAGNSGSSTDLGSSTEHQPAKLSLVNLAVKEAGRGPKPGSGLEITVHNIGGHLAVIDGAKIEVIRAYELPRCASQDDIPLSQTYGVPLPVGSQPGTVLTPALHQQVGADEADRFEIALGAKWPNGRATSTVYLFEIRLSLHTDASQRDFSVGRALVSLPRYPYPGEYYWNAETPKVIHDFISASPGYAAELRRHSMPCWQANTVALRRAFETKAVRSSDLVEIQKTFISPVSTTLE